MSQKLPRWSLSWLSPPSFSTLPFNSGNKVGAGFGTGYCDAQCPHDVKYINGEPNSQVEMVMVMVVEMVYFLAMVMVTMTSKHLQKDDFLKGLDPKRDGRQCGFRPLWLMLLRTWYLGSQWDLNGDHCHYLFAWWWSWSWWSSSSLLLIKIKGFHSPPVRYSGSAALRGNTLWGQQVWWKVIHDDDHYYDKIMMIMILMIMMI